MDLRNELILFLDSIRDYVRESGTNIAHDDRESCYFVDLYLKRRTKQNEISECTLSAVKLRGILKHAYHWGRDNGENRSEKNFNDFLQTEQVQKALSRTNIVVQTEHVRFCTNRSGKECINPSSCKAFGCNKPM